MQIPLQITFRNMESSRILQEWIQAEVAKLENFYRPIMGCRVAVEVPHRHHRRGVQYHVRIDLTLPGGELVIKHQPNLRSQALQEGKSEITKYLEVGIPHKDLRLTIDDAFKAAGRRLQDYARRQGRRVKTHMPAPSARVSRIIGDEGYGFLMTPEGQEIYFHKDSVLNRGFCRLTIGTLVNFTEEEGEKGPQASTVRIAGKRGTRRAVRAAAAL
jgi:cold shock CspA family protein/ribosome-associated translation inhibitor RaiA